MKAKAEISQAKGIFSPKAVAAMLPEGNMLLPFKYRKMVALQGKAFSFVLEYKL